MLLKWRQNFSRNIILLFIISLLFACKKHIDAGIKTNVSGRIADYITQEPIANIPVYIYEYATGFNNLQFLGIIDSAVSGPDGKYHLNFTTTGHGIEYKIAISLNDFFYSVQSLATLPIGKDTVINFYAAKLHVLKARLQITDNPNPPMGVSTINGLYANVWGTSNDTVVFMKVFPNQDNQVQFTITNIDTPSIYNYELDTFHFPGFLDTFDRTFPVSPKTFIKRG